MNKEGLIGTVKKISQVEDTNFQNLSLGIFQELDFLSRCDEVYTSAQLEPSKPLYMQMAVFYSDSHNYLIAATHSLLRGHAMHAFSHTRLALESCAYANKILRRDSLDRLRIFQEESPAGKEYRDLFGQQSLFKGMEEYVGTYSTLCHGAHPSIGGQSARIRIDQTGAASSGYFDDWDDNSLSVYKHSAMLIASLHIEMLGRYSLLLSAELKNANGLEILIQQLREDTLAYTKNTHPQIWHSPEGM